MMACKSRNPLVHCYVDIECSPSYNSADIINICILEEVRELVLSTEPP